MNFLNEAAQRYPAAVSFASGRPAEKFFRLGEWREGTSYFIEKYAERSDISLQNAERRMAQYGDTAGIICEEVALQLRHDHGLACSAEQVVITAGCQEAMALCMQALCAQPGHVVLSRNPTYIGATGVADAAGIGIHPIDESADEPLDHALMRTIDALASQGLTASALYLIPDFDNPTGEVISRMDREHILSVCAARRVVVLEDNPYGMFRFEGEFVPSMAALDTAGCVIHLGTYSKTLFPSVRVGSAAFPKTLFGDTDASKSLLQDVVRRKSFMTVNTSQLNQALVGGVLLQENGTLENVVKAPTAFYRNNRDAMVQALEHGFRGCGEDVRWNHPNGGFFLSVRLPFEFSEAELDECAVSHGVLTMPMRYFALDDSQRDTVRFAYSNLDPDTIYAGISRFCDFAVRRMRSLR